MMKTSHLFLIVRLYACLCHCPVSLAQESREDVLSLAGKTLDAVRHKDTDFLAKLADPDGVFIGVDVPSVGTARFKKELSDKRGVYCVIFDASCLAGKGENSRSLREILVQQPVTMSVSKIGVASPDAAVVVKKAGKPGEDLFTLIFRRVRGNWMLQQIEYW